MITRIEAINYRCFRHLDIQIGAYQVFAGVNGSGKTTLLDIPVLLGDMLNGSITNAFLEIPAHYGSPRAQSFEELVHQKQGDFFSLALEADLPEVIVNKLMNSDDYQVPKKMLKDPSKWMRTMRYEIRFELFNGRELHVLDEFLYLMPENGSKTGARSRSASEGELLQNLGGVGNSPLKTWHTIIERRRGKASILRAEMPSKATGKRLDIPVQLNAEELALANVFADIDKFPATIWFRDLLEKKAIQYMPSGAALRKPCSPSRLAAKSLQADGANLPWLVMDLKQHTDMFEAWVDHVRTALPNISQIDAIERDDDHHAYLRVTYVGDYEVTSSGLSDGTLHILALTILPYLRDLPELICVEEPENGIHPRAIETILQSLSSIYDSQVWVTTQSPIVLAHTDDLSAVTVMQTRHNGGVTAVLGNEHPRLRDWQGSIDLGSLFAAGVLS
jgi:predicted ATPase